MLNIMDKTQERAPLLSEGWNRELDELTGTRELEAEELEILHNGQRALEVWRSTLLKARKSIRIYTYYFRSRSAVGRELVGILEQKARSGVSVSIIASRYAQIAMAPRDVTALRRAGCTVLLAGDMGYPLAGRRRASRKNRILIPLPKGLRQGGRDDSDEKPRVIDASLHIKMLIVDGCTAILGGRNIHESYFTSWEDADVFLTGPAAADAANRFDREMASFGGPPPPSDPTRVKAPVSPAIPVRCVLSNPWEHTYETMKALVHAVSSARSSIDIITQYIIPPPPLMNALTAAARRGVDVNIMTNSLKTGKAVAGGVCWYLSSYLYKHLLAANIHIYEWRGEGRASYLHTKLFLMDAQWLAVGSFNLSVRSAYLESEILCCFHDRIRTREAADFFRNSLAQGCREVTSEDVRKYSFLTRLLQRAAQILRIFY